MAASRNTNYGRRLLPTLVDEIAQNQPEREAFQVPLSDNPQDGWKSITFKTYANAINRYANLIVNTYGKSREGNFPTIAYIGPQDARYVVLLFAAVKAGYQALFISPRNSQESQLNLFEKTNCRICWYAHSYAGVAEPWFETREMKALEVNAIEEWFSGSEEPHFPYDKTFERAEWDPLVILHTSGSTGNPKPVVVRAGMLATGDAMRVLPEWQGTRFWLAEWVTRSKRLFLPMPLFHAAALYLFIIHAMYAETPVVFGFPNRALSADAVAESLAHMDVESALLPPSILVDMSQSDEYIQSLKKLNFVGFGGGDLLQESGDRLVEKGVHLSNVISATEALFPVYFQKDPKFWKWMMINSEVFGTDWRKNGEEAYELVVVRKDEHPGLQAFFYTFPDENEVSTKDLWIPHPTAPNQWLYDGRADDIIVFSNGEKLNPVTIESIIADHPSVKGVLVVGANRFQPAVLLEPFEHPGDDKGEQEFIDKIWPLVEKANKDSVAHGRVERAFIALIHPDEHFLRAGKGTIQRGRTVKLFADEIDQIYAKAEEGAGSVIPKLDTVSEDSLLQVIHKSFRLPSLEADGDFFAAGVDSLQIINATRLLRASLRNSGHATDTTLNSALGARAVYNNQSPRKLAQYILRAIFHGKTETAEEAAQREIQDMQSLYKEYTTSLIKSTSKRPSASSASQTILLTGSTGMLGSYLLDLLTRSPHVSQVICLNRASDGGASQQADAMKSRDLNPSYASKTFFHTYDISAPHLGLPDTLYSRLLKDTDRIIHNAWPVNFNLATTSFKTSIAGTRHLADLAASASKRVHVTFVSSVGTATCWPTSKGPVPEARIDDYTLPGNGYGASKMVASFILEDAGQAGDFPAAMVRVGQIAGPEAKAGMWNKTDWLPRIVASSLYLGVLPEALGGMDRVDWLPVERVARTLVDVSGAIGGEPNGVKDAEESNTGYFNCVNPSATTWSTLVPAVREFYGERLKETVPWKQWVELLENSRADEKNPGYKLLDTYRGMVAAEETRDAALVFDTTRSSKVAEGVKGATTVSGQLMAHWCEQWGF